MTHRPMPVIGGLHHAAWRCRDAEETRHFYEDLLGLPLVHVIRAEKVPSTGEHCPYVHVFFELGDGACLAFFDLGDNQAALPSANTPAWVHHLALRVASERDLAAAHHRLLAAGVAVIGPTDHGFVSSIYFMDPNGLRLELTTPTGDPGFMATARLEAHAACAAWTAAKHQRTPSPGNAPFTPRLEQETP
ncbi:VOC family protein [Pseudacidovorax sp. NFM-22]|uniref:VOC family protein n=1 Tax=Pseudacidovorax sp. NFM-22 TaxID=2744469 RepID=UPI001F235CA5|nr:VOC family protein [Pseudacidovorax sp. NFM-22]